MRHAIFLAVLATFLSACSYYEQFGLRQGASGEADVQRAMGTPALEIRNPDGTRKLAYPKGPLGTETFMAYLDREGRLERVEQVLTEDHFGRIHPGTTTAEEVRALIGPPWRTVRFDNLRQDAWDYRFQDTWGYLAEFSAMVDERGIVAGKVTIRLNLGREGGIR